MKHIGKVYFPKWQQVLMCMEKEGDGIPRQVAAKRINSHYSGVYDIITTLEKKKLVHITNTKIMGDSGKNSKGFRVRKLVYLTASGHNFAKSMLETLEMTR